MAAWKRPHLLRTIGWIVLVCVLVVAFEEVLDITALDLFPHHDTADCAGADTFCFPDGRPGPTGGAIIFLVGNFGAGVLAAALLVQILTRRR